MNFKNLGRERIWEDLVISWPQQSTVRLIRCIPRLHDTWINRYRYRWTSHAILQDSRWRQGDSRSFYNKHFKFKYYYKLNLLEVPVILEVLDLLSSWEHMAQVTNFYNYLLFNCPLTVCKSGSWWSLIQSSQLCWIVLFHWIMLIYVQIQMRSRWRSISLNGFYSFITNNILNNLSNNLFDSHT